MMGIMVPTNQVRSRPTQPGLGQCITQRGDIARVISQPKVIVAAKRQQLCPVCDQLRLLRPGNQATGPVQTVSFTLFNLQSKVTHKSPKVSYKAKRPAQCLMVKVGEPFPGL
jgi:hypothetical protein